MLVRENPRWQRGDQLPIKGRPHPGSRLKVTMPPRKLGTTESSSLVRSSHIALGVAMTNPNMPCGII